MKNKTIFLGAILLALLVSVFSVSAVTTTIRPDGQGAYSAWSNTGCGSGSSEWQCVDETTLNTSDNVSTNVQGAAESFTFVNLALDPSAVISSVTLKYYGRRVSSTRFQVEPLIVSNGSNYTGGITNLTSIWSLYSKSYALNPATGTSWTISSVDALEAGLQASSGTNRGGGLAQIYAEVNYTIPSTCTDSDGGNFPEIKGNVSGFKNNAPYVFTDFCDSSVILAEYTCSGTAPLGQNVSCVTNTTNACVGGICVFV